MTKLIPTTNDVCIPSKKTAKDHYICFEQMQWIVWKVYESKKPLTTKQVYEYWDDALSDIMLELYPPIKPTPSVLQEIFTFLSGRNILIGRNGKWHFNKERSRCIMRLRKILYKKLFTGIDLRHAWNTYNTMHPKEEQLTQPEIQDILNYIEDIPEAKIYYVNKYKFWGILP